MFEDSSSHAEIDKVFHQKNAFGDLTIYILNRILNASGFLHYIDEDEGL